MVDGCRGLHTLRRFDKSLTFSEILNEFSVYGCSVTVAEGYVCKGGAVRLSDNRLHWYGTDLIVAYRVGTLPLTVLLK